MLGPLRIRCSKHTSVNELKQNAANGDIHSDQTHAAREYADLGWRRGITYDSLP